MNVFVAIKAHIGKSATWTIKNSIEEQKTFAILLPVYCYKSANYSIAGHSFEI